jgi:crotonobetainyl-CoA:carnitine CoA-transferase CaiB-like acyl-CoA transferase
VDTEASPASPLSGNAQTRALDITILDISQSPGAGFAASLLADFGARVYVVERPPQGARLRHLGPPELGADWWDIVGRNKRSLAIDPAHRDAGPVLTRLLSCVDMVITDIGKPGWASDPWLRLLDGLAPQPLVVDLFPTGADRRELWPWSVAPELTGAATGMVALTGYESGPPVQPEMPLAEYLAGALAATGALAELRKARLTGTPPVHLPVAMHEAVQRAIEWQLPVATVFGQAEPRIGNRFPLSAGVANMHRTRDGKHVALSAATQAVASRMMVMIGSEALSRDARFASPQARAANMSALYAIIDDWVGARSADEVFAAAQEADVVIGPIYSADDMLSDPQIVARDNIVHSERQVPMPAVLPSISGIARNGPSAAPAIGQHSAEALTLAGYGATDIERFRATGLIWAEGS